MHLPLFAGAIQSDRFPELDDFLFAALGNWISSNAFVDSYNTNHQFHMCVILVIELVISRFPQSVWLSSVRKGRVWQKVKKVNSWFQQIRLCNLNGKSRKLLILDNVRLCFCCVASFVVGVCGARSWIEWHVNKCLATPMDTHVSALRFMCGWTKLFSV